MVAQISLFIFHLYIIFIGVYSTITFFSALRFGRSQLLTIGIAIFYFSLLGSLYWQALKIISNF